MKAEFINPFLNAATQVLESELGSFGSDGKMRPLAMGVLDQPVHREETRKARRATPSYENSTPDQAIASRFLERDGRFARPPESLSLTWPSSASSS